MRLDLRNGLYGLFVSALALPEKNYFDSAERCAAELSSKEGDLEYLLDRVPRFARALRACRGLPARLEGLSRDLRVGAILFNQGLFFDCHEFLETAWKRREGREKIFIQGLIQAAAGFHKFELGSPSGAAGLLKSAAEKLGDAELGGVSFRDFSIKLLDSARRIEEGGFKIRNAPKMDS